MRSYCVCALTACAHVLWPRPDIYCNYYVIAKFKQGGAPGCYDARGNTALLFAILTKNASYIYLPPSCVYPQYKYAWVHNYSAHGHELSGRVRAHALIIMKSTEVQCKPSAQFD